MLNSNILKLSINKINDNSRKKVLNALRAIEEAKKEFYKKGLENCKNSRAI